MSAGSAARASRKGSPLPRITGADRLPPALLEGDLPRHASPLHPARRVYGTGELRSPSAQVLPATHTDHDVPLVRAHLDPQP